MRMQFLVLLLVFGVLFITCSQSTGGVLTLTDIPSSFHGKYLLLMAEWGGGHSDIMSNEDNSELILISGNRLSIPLWTNDSDGNGWIRYKGNHTVEVGISIFNTEELDFRNSTELWFESVTFSNGSAKKTFNDINGLND